MYDDSLDRDLRATEEFIEQWLENAARVREAVPYAYRNLEYIKFERQALGSLPTEANVVEFPFTHDYYLQRHQCLQGTFQPLPRIDMDLVTTSTAVNASGTANYLPFFDQVAELGTASAQEYRVEQLRSLEEWQEKQHRPEEVRMLLENLKRDELLQRFDEARRAYDMLVAGAGTREAAANEIRILVDGVKGELFAKARRWPKEQIKWQTMADRLAKRTLGNLAVEALSREEARRETVYGQLSTAAKKYEGGGQHDMGRLWRQVLDHIYVCLGSASV